MISSVRFLLVPAKLRHRRGSREALLLVWSVDFGLFLLVLALIVECSRLVYHSVIHCRLIQCLIHNARPICYMFCSMLESLGHICSFFRSLIGLFGRFKGVVRLTLLLFQTVDVETSGVSLELLL